MFGKVFSSLKCISIKVVLKTGTEEQKTGEEAQDVSKGKQKRISKFHPSWKMSEYETCAIVN